MGSNPTSLVIECCWIAWIAYWVIMAFSTKPTIERGGFVAYRVVILIVFAGCFAVLRLLRGSSQGPLWHASVALGVVSDCIVVAGAVFTVWARVTLGRNWSAEVTLKADHELIEAGPYGLARHPIYTGLIMMALGTALNYGRPIGFALFVGLCAGLWWKARQEERLMSREFPDDYAAYKRRVHAIIPFVLVLLLMLALAPLSASAATGRTPVVFFPGYGATTLRVEVRDQTSVPGCPRSGSFEDGIPADVGTMFSQVCRDRLLTPRWSNNPHLSFPERFSLPPGVTVSIPHYGQTSSAPAYGALYTALESAGYRAGRDLVVAGYNFRLTPDLGGFRARTEQLIQQTWRRNGHRPVRLVGHSNGPLYIQYLLTHASARWRRTYIQGFTDIAGNLPGQGSTWSWVFTGVDIPTGFSLPTTLATARSSARLIALSPSTWMSTSDPAVFGRREVVVTDHATGRSYTPADTDRLLHDAGLAAIKPIVHHYLGFVKFADRAHYPDVDVSVEKGSGLATQVGIVLPNLTLGQVVDQVTADVINLSGDSNQEDITNDAVSVWRHMRCYRFRFTDNPGVSHLGLTSDAGVIRRLLADLAQPPSRCG